MIELEENLRRSLSWLLLAPVALPLVIWGGLMYPYLVPKTLLFNTLALLTLGVFAVLAFSGEPFHYVRLWYKRTWIPAALLALAYAASLAGLDFYRSFWSLFVRGDGLLELTLSVALFYVLIVAADRRFLERLLLGVSLVGGAVAVYGIGEWLFSGGRIGSLLGNAAFFAGYLGMAFFATFAVARRSSSVVGKRIFYALSVLELIAVFLSATRGTILALLVAGLLAAVLFLFTTTDARLRTLLISVLGGGVLIGGAFFAFRTEIAALPLGGLSRLASISTTDPDVASRLFIWKNMVGQIAQRPVLGVGAEHIDALFNSFYDPSAIEEQWFDRSHNAYLDYAAQYGLLGPVLYLGLIVALCVVAWRHREEDVVVGTMLALAAVTYAVQNIFVFDTISTWWLFLVLLAVLTAVGLPEDVQQPLPARAPWLGWIVAVGALFLVYPTALAPLMANHDLFEAYLYHVSDVARANAALAAGEALHTYGDLEYGYEAYDMYTGQQVSMLSGAERVSAYVAAEAILKANFERYTYDARTALYLAHVLALTPSEITRDDALFHDALRRAIALSPKRSQAWYLLANDTLSAANAHPAGSSERAQGYAEVASTLKGYELLVPGLAEPHYVLADIYLAEGNTAAAAAEAALGKERYVSDLEVARRAAAYYVNTKDWNNAAFFLKEVTTLAATDYVSWYDFAKVNYVLGNYPAAETIVAMLREKDPNILATDQAFLSAITAYEHTKN